MVQLMDILIFHQKTREENSLFPKQFRKIETEPVHVIFHRNDRVPIATGKHSQKYDSKAVAKLLLIFLFFLLILTRPENGGADCEGPAISFWETCNNEVRALTIKTLLLSKLP